MSAVWARVCVALQDRVGEPNYSRWIAPLRSRWMDGHLALEAPDPTTRDRVARHFLRTIEATLAEALGRAHRVRLDLESAPAVLPLAAASPSPEHTFDTFVVGEANRTACAAARALVDGDVRAPLFLHGRSGVGKTHLLHAIFHALDGSGMAVVCVAAARLVTALVTAYESGAADAFWSHLTAYGALLLDDAHSIGARDELQDRLLDGLAGWIVAGRLLVLTCDREPTFVTRLRDRFEESAIAAIAPPEPALRTAILRHKARRHGIELDAQLAARLANDLGGNVRRLEGALTRLVAHARLRGTPVDEALAVAVFPELAPRSPAPVTIDEVIEATARAFATSVRRLRGRDRSHAVRLPRTVAMHLGRKLLGSSYRVLGDAFGRDHTTVLQACRSVAARVEADPSLAATVTRIERRLTTGSP